MKIKYSEQIRQLPDNKSGVRKMKQVAFLIGDWAIGLQYPLRNYGTNWISSDRYFWKTIWHTAIDEDGDPTAYAAQIRFLWFAIAFKFHLRNESDGQ